jgi:hypothetical protein
MMLAESSQERLQELAVEPRSTRARIVQALDQEARCVSPPSLVITLRHMRACRSAVLPRGALGALHALFHL